MCDAQCIVCIKLKQNRVQIFIKIVKKSVQKKSIGLVLDMDRKNCTNRAVSTDIHEEIDPQTQDTVVVETITTTTTTTTTKKRIYVKDSNIDLTNIQNLLDDKTDACVLPAITNIASNHSCHLPDGSSTKQKPNEHFEKSANASHSPLSSTKVSNEVQSDDDNAPLITVGTKKNYLMPKSSAGATTNSNHKVDSPNLSRISRVNVNHKDSPNIEQSKKSKKKTKTIASKNMPKTPKKYKDKRIEDLISQYISVRPVDRKAKGQSRSNVNPNSTTENHNLSDIVEASFEASDSTERCRSNHSENDNDLSFFMQDSSPMELGNEKNECQTKMVKARTKKYSKEMSATKPQSGKRSGSPTKLMSQPGSKDNKNDENYEMDEPEKLVPAKRKNARRTVDEETELETAAPPKKGANKATKETTVPNEIEQTEMVKTNKRLRGRLASGIMNREPKPKTIRSRAVKTRTAKQTKPATVDEPTFEATEQNCKSEKRSSKRISLNQGRPSLKKCSIENLDKYYGNIKKTKPSKSGKSTKTKTHTNNLNDITNNGPQQVDDELPMVSIDDKPVKRMNRNLFDQEIKIYSPSSRKNFRTDGDSNVIIPKALIKSKLMNLSDAPDEWMKRFDGAKEFKVNASDRLRLHVPAITEDTNLKANAKGGGDILTRINQMRKPILVREN